MSHGSGIVMCNLCTREFQKYNPKDLKMLYGINITRNKNFNLILDFVDVDKTADNKHICTQCISCILNKFDDKY